MIHLEFWQKVVAIGFLVSGGKTPAETCSGCIMGPSTVIMSIN